MTICGDCLVQLSECAHAGEYKRERASAPEPTVNDLVKEIAENAQL